MAINSLDRVELEGDEVEEDGDLISGGRLAGWGATTYYL